MLRCSIKTLPGINNCEKNPTKIGNQHLKNCVLMSQPVRFGTKECRIDLKLGCKSKFFRCLDVKKWSIWTLMGAWRAFIWSGLPKTCVAGPISGSIWGSMKVQEGPFVAKLSQVYEEVLFIVHWHIAKLEYRTSCQYRHSVSRQIDRKL